jgi:nucleotide-binding universal stress UspA family protein
VEPDLERRPRILCGVSDSVGARAAIEYSETLSDVLGAELVLVHVAESSNPSDPSALVDAAVEEEASLLLVGWSRRRIRSGRLVRRLMRRSPCPVVLVPHRHASP